MIVTVPMHTSTIAATATVRNLATAVARVFTAVLYMISTPYIRGRRGRPGGFRGQGKLPGTAIPHRFGTGMVKTTLICMRCIITINSTVLNRTYTQKLYISLFLLTRFDPVY